jgi:hypothetical protein
MVITELVLQILAALRRYKFLNRRLIQDLFFPRDKDGSVTRDALRKLRDRGLVKTVRAEGGVPDSTSTAPVYVPTEAGCCVLARHRGDMNLLLDCQPNTRAWVNFTHYTYVSRLFITHDAALQSQDYVRVPRLYFEHDILNPDETDPRKKFKLYTVVKEEMRGENAHKIVCVPDAATEVRVGKFCRAYYWELERGTDTPRRTAAKKAPGYAGLCHSRQWRTHFPDAQDMRVVAVCPNVSWRDALRAAMKDKPGAELWLFVANEDLTPDSFLHAPIFYGCLEGPRPFVRPPSPAPVAVPVAEAAEEWREEQAQ